MKFYIKNGFWHSALILKFLLIMRLTFVLLITLFLQISLAGYGQKVTISQKNASLEQVFRQIHVQTGYNILCDNDLLQGAGNIDIQLSGVSLKQALDASLAGQQLSYTIVDKTIVIKRDYFPHPELVMPVTVTVTGSVTDSKGEPLPGVSVIEKGTTNGVVSDASGKYSLKVAGLNSIVVFSFIGFDSQEVKVGSQTTINIKLHDKVSGLDEIVVIGYGSQKKATLSGSISTVNAKAFQDKGTVTNPLQALEGQVPGVIITRSSGVPGNEGWNVQVRGASSINGSNPLYIIDGIAVSDNNALNSLNPNDIESMSFLKDASTAIYGSRGAGGVILITTKKGKNGKTIVQYDASYSDKKIGLVPQQMNIDQYATGLLEARTNDGLGTDDVWVQLAKFMMTHKGQVAPASAFPGNFGDVADIPDLDVDYNKQLYKNGATNQHNLSVAGGSEKSDYRLSLGYTNDGGLLRYGDNNSKRYNIRFSNNYNFSDRVKLQSTVALDKNDVVIPSQIGAILGLGFQPGFPAFTVNGMPYAWGGNPSPESQAKFGGDNNTFTARWYINENLTWKIVDHLNLVVNLGYDPTTITNNNQQKAIQFYNYLGTIPGLQSPTQANSAYSESSATDNYYNANAYLEYKNTFAQKHDIGLTLGSQYERDEYNFFSAVTTNQASANVPGLGLGIGDNTTHNNSGSQNHYAIGSYFGRFNYAYDNRYLFEAQFRYDGSSKFDAQNRWKPFYGFSGAWRITQEKFMKNVTFFDDLKLRASYGTSGNQNGIGLYDYIQLLNIGYSTGTGSNYPILGTSPAVTLGPTNTLVSLNRTWEKIEKSNFALDFTLLNNRLSGTGEIFLNNNVNMLLPVTYPQVLGAIAPAQNVGYLRTKGWEVSLNWTDKIGSFQYHFGGNITYNKNNLINYGGQNLIVQGINGATQGQPLNSIYGLQYAGRIQTQAQLTEYVGKYLAGNTIGLPATLRVGDNMFKDVNGDGKLTNADFVNLGTEDPRYSYSFNLGANYKGFDFSAIFQGVGKRTIFRNTQARVPFATFFWSQDAFSSGNTWEPNNTGAYYPKLSSSGTWNNYNYQASSFSVENGAYIRLKNIVLGYTLPQKWVQGSKFISKVRIYVGGNDLWEHTKIHDGFDPEAPSSIFTNSGNLGQYPFYRTITGGVNVTF